MEACAPYLAELCGKHDNSNPFPINVRYEIFHQLLFYVYGGKINETFYETNSAELIDAADKYGVTNLKLEAEVWHVKLHDISLSNVVDSLLWADSKHLALVKEQVMNFVMENKKDVITLMSSKDSSLPPSAVTDILAAVRLNDAEKSNDISSYTDFSLMRVGTLRQKLQ